MTPSLPKAFEDSLRSYFPKRADGILNGIAAPPITSIKVNRAKLSKSFSLEQVAWNENGYYLAHRPSFVSDPWYHAGAYYPQEASSMVVETVAKVVLQNNPHPLVADLCGAPGGKSIGLLDALQGRGHLIANEVVPKRNRILQENLVKWGFVNYSVTQQPILAFGQFPSLFDLVVVDAPCSGEGMFRKDPVAISEWSEKNVAQCVVRQNEILTCGAQTVAPGGHLIYSTCTFNPKENEDQITALENKGFTVQALPNLEKWGAESPLKKGCYHFFPDHMKGEGFFIALLKKEGELTQRNTSSQKKEMPKLPFVQEDNLRFEERANWGWISSGADLLPKQFSALLKPVSTGVQVAQKKGRQWQPHPYLAFSLSANLSAFPSVNLNLKEAQWLLHRSLPKVSSNQKGWHYALFEGLPIGLIKHLGTRTNNYYPKEFRIRIDKSELTDFSLSNAH